MLRHSRRLSSDNRPFARPVSGHAGLGSHYHGTPILHAGPRVKQATPEHTEKL
jgi:hypothetical protein